MVESAGSYVYLPDANAPPTLEQVGGKALGLFLLQEIDCEVPAWFAITTGANRVPETERPALMAEVEATVQRLEMTGGYLAVRSSACAEDGKERSFAGQFASVLFVKPSELAAAIDHVWASADSDYCREYARRNEVPMENLVPAVVVQRMISPDVAGVMFTADPVEGDRDLTVIAATYGLGEGIASGACNGDTYSIDNAAAVVKREIAHKAQCVEYDSAKGDVCLVPVPESLRDAQVCPDAVLARLAAQGDAIAAALGEPQDIEWCLEGDHIHILQTRPITTLKRSAETVRVWDNANIVESYPGMTLPLTFSFIEPMYAQVYRQLFGLFGFSERYLERHRASFRMLGYFRGRVYYNLLSWYWNIGLLPGGRRHLRNFDEMLGTGNDLEASDLPQPRAPGPVLATRIVVGLIGRFFFQPWQIRRFMKRVTKAREKADATDLDAMRLDELAVHYKRFESLLVRHWTTPQFNDFYCQTATGWLKSAISRWIGETFVASMHELLPMDESVESERAVESLCSLAASIRKRQQMLEACRSLAPSELLAKLRGDPVIGPRFDEHVRLFGDRWHGELKLETVTPREDPEMLVKVLAQHVLAPPRKSSDDRASAIHEAIERLPIVKRCLIGLLALVSRRLIANRENTRFERTRVFGLVRRGFRAIGQKLAARGHLATAEDVFYLTKNEIFGFIEGTGVDADLTAIVSGRRLAAEEWRQSPAPGRFRTSGLLAEMTAPEEPAAKREAQRILSGIGASPGVIRARLRLIRSPEELDGARGRIIATESTDPGWSFIFPLISGVLVERGSMLSHAAIVAREMGIPAVVAIDGLMEQLLDGSLVEMDGSTGTVKVLEE